MKTGYGRGYYGEGQLAPPPVRRRSSGWIKLALVVGAGAVIWLMWPRALKPEHESAAGDDAPKPPLPPSVPQDVEGQMSLPPAISQGVEAQGYPVREAASSLQSMEVHGPAAHGYPEARGYPAHAVMQSPQGTEIRGYAENHGYGVSSAPQFIQAPQLSQGMEEAHSYPGFRGNSVREPSQFLPGAGYTEGRGYASREAARFSQGAEGYSSRRSYSPRSVSQRPRSVEGRSYSASRGYAGRSVPQLSSGADTSDHSGQQAYEDAVVASARQLLASGAKVVLAPHLAHLAPRLET